MAISNGTASNIPTTPHIQPQKSSPRKTATGFMLAIRLTINGVMIIPSIVVMTSEAIDTRLACQADSNWMNAITNAAKATTVGPK